jgi:hypothetical protein
VTQHQDLELLRALPPAEQQDQLDQAARETYTNNAAKNNLPRTGGRRYRRAEPERPPRHEPAGRICAPHGCLESEGLIAKADPTGLPAVRHLDKVCQTGGRSGTRSNCSPLACCRAARSSACWQRPRVHDLPAVGYPLHAPECWAWGRAVGVAMRVLYGLGGVCSVLVSRRWKRRPMLREDRRLKRNTNSSR